jgi:esterase/lipase superfamily enzyme
MHLAFRVGLMSAAFLALLSGCSTDFGQKSTGSVPVPTESPAPPTFSTASIGEQETTIADLPLARRADAGSSGPKQKMAEKSRSVPVASNELYDVVTLFWATNRQQTTRPPAVSKASHQESTAPAPAVRPHFGRERSKELTTGIAKVTIPKIGRNLGEITRPREVGVLGWELYAEKEDPRKHFTIGRLDALPVDKFVQLAKAHALSGQSFRDHALVFVHGYNTSFDDAIYRTAQLTHDMGFDGSSFVFSWPSNASETGYLYDRDSVDYSVQQFTAFIELLSRQVKLENIHIVAHSMGTRLVFDEFIGPNGPTGLSKLRNVRHVVLAAPDIDRTVLEQRAASAGVAAKAITLYASKNDRALEISKKFAKGVPRAGDVVDGKPVIVAGVDSIDISASATYVFLGTYHNTYAEKAHILSDIALLMKTGTRPPDTRSPITYKAVSVPQGKYWRYVAN